MGLGVYMGKMKGCNDWFLGLGFKDFVRLEFFGLSPLDHHERSEHSRTEHDFNY